MKDMRTLNCTIKIIYIHPEYWQFYQRQRSNGSYNWGYWQSSSNQASDKLCFRSYRWPSKSLEFYLLWSWPWIPWKNDPSVWRKLNWGFPCFDWQASALQWSFWTRKLRSLRPKSRCWKGMARSLLEEWQV